MYNDLMVNVKLNKNKTVIDILYRVHFNTLFRKESSLDEPAIHLEKINSHNNIVNINKKDILEKLSQFGCTPKEIKSFINISEFNAVNENDMKFSISDYEYVDAEITLDEILTGENSKLTDIQKKILKQELKKEITYDEYTNLSEPEKQIYKKGPYDYICIHNTINFLNEFITKYQADIEYISFDGKLKTNSINHEATLTVASKKNENIYCVEFTKYYKNKTNPLIIPNSVPLTKLHHEFKDAFKDFDESKFISKLTPDICKEPNDMIIKSYIFMQTDKLKAKIINLRQIAKDAIINDKPMPLTKNELNLINAPIKIKLDTDIAPDGYERLDIACENLKPEYKDILNDTETKTVSVSDIVYLINYIMNI